MRAAEKRFFNSAMLVAEGDFKVKNLFARALKPEMPGLDDPGMDRADGDLVNLAALNPEKLSI